MLRAARFDGAGEGENGGQILTELIVQFAGKGTPLIVADFEKPLGQDGAMLTGLLETHPEIANGLSDHGKLHGSEARQRCSVLTMRHPLQCGNDRACGCEGVSNRERGEHGDSYRHQ
jgi:hypothetical protein